MRIVGAGTWPVEKNARQGELRQRPIDHGAGVALLSPTRKIGRIKPPSVVIVGACPDDPRLCPVTSDGCSPLRRRGCSGLIPGSSPGTSMTVESGACAVTRYRFRSTGLQRDK